jgi:hypothetical protein
MEIGLDPYSEESLPTQTAAQLNNHPVSSHEVVPQTAVH